MRISHNFAEQTPVSSPRVTLEATTPSAKSPSLLPIPPSRRRWWGQLPLLSHSPFQICFPLELGPRLRCLSSTPEVRPPPVCRRRRASLRRLLPPGLVCCQLSRSDLDPWSVTVLRCAGGGRRVGTDGGAVQRCLSSVSTSALMYLWFMMEVLSGAPRCGPSCCSRDTTCPVRGTSLKLQVEERECRLVFIIRRSPPAGSFFFARSALPRCRSGQPSGCSAGWPCRLMRVWASLSTRLGQHSRRRSGRFGNARRGKVGAVMSRCATGGDDDTRRTSWWGVRVRRWSQFRQSWASSDPARAWVLSSARLGRHNKRRFGRFSDACRSEVGADMSRVCDGRRL